MSGGGNGGYDASALGGQFGNKLTAAINSPTFNQSSFAEPSGATNIGLNGLYAASTNPTYSKGVQGSINDFADIASGNRFGMNDAGYATLRQNVADDTAKAVNSTFTNSGRFGSGSHVQDLSQGVGNALAGLDYSNFQNDQQRQFTAAGMLPGLYQAGLAPAQTMLGVGQANDAIATDRLAGAQAPYNRLLQALGAFSGSSQAPGMQEQAPWYSQLLGGLATGAGILGSFI